MTQATPLTPEQGHALIAALPLANPVVTLDALSRLLATLAGNPPPAGDYFAILERLRDPLIAQQSVRSRQFAAKALPLAPGEAETFRSAVNLWRSAARAYAHCASGQSWDPLKPEDARTLATLLQRCLQCSCGAIIEHYRARQEVGRGLWLELFGYFDSAEEWGLARHPVHDPLQPGDTLHCAGQLASLLLLDLSDPYVRAPREFSHLAHLARRYCHLVDISLATREGYGIDLMSDRGIQLAAEAPSEDPNWRRVVTDALQDQLAKLHGFLRQGVTPLSLGLMESGTPASWLKLIEEIQLPWRLAPAKRRFGRHACEDDMALAHGYDTIQFFVAGKEFEQPAASKVYSRAEIDSLVTFRHQVDPSAQLHISDALHGTRYQREQWQILDQSAGGFRIRRRIAGSRLHPDQLVSVTMMGSRALLAQICWLTQLRDGGLSAGLSLLQGIPTAAAVRPAKTSQQEPFTRAMLLPAKEGSHAASLVLPKGSYRPEARLTVAVEDRLWTAVLSHVIRVGIDFEQIAFTVDSQAAV